MHIHLRAVVLLLLVSGTPRALAQASEGHPSTSSQQQAPAAGGEAAAVDASRLDGAPAEATDQPRVLTTNDAARLSPPPPPNRNGSSAHAGFDSSPEPRSASHGDGGDDDDEKNPMDWLGVSVKVGLANVNAGNITNPTYLPDLAAFAAQNPELLAGTGLLGNGACTPIERKCRTPSRRGFHLAVTLHLGGDGAGWDVEPYLSTSGEAIAVGAYTGPKFDIHVIDPLYLGFGFGFKAAYVSADGWRYGGDVFGRIPVHATYYVARQVAITLEGSFGAGVSFFVSDPIRLVDPRNNRPLATAAKVAFGAARSWDLTVGLRFP